jgi:protein-S-isoprenylcysteine O-methyltransferase Ste14
LCEVTITHHTWTGTWLAFRSLMWTLLCPGVVAAYVPWRFFGLREAEVDPMRPPHLLGIGCVLLGAVFLLACIVEFARSGRGTLSPADPPRHLVVRGPYRYVRNPMYLAVTMIILGEALLAGSVGLGVYWAVWFVGANLFVIGYEEPTLRRLFGASYEEYTREVGRWIPTLRRRRAFEPRGSA